MDRSFNRRQFLGAAAAATLAAPNVISAAGPTSFKISLAEWSLHKVIFAKKLSNLDFARVSKEELGIDAIEYVNQFFKDKAEDESYLTELNKRAKDHGVTQLLIMVDGEGRLGDPDDKKRKQAVKNHYKWIHAAKKLGCHSIRVNAATGNKGTFEDQMERAVNGLSALTEYGAKHQINVIVENHGGLSSNGKWLAGVMKKVNSPYCGTLPDFGNFKEYDRYQGVKELMPFAKAVSAKSYDFDKKGNETHTDFFKMLTIVLDHDYHGYVGIEYEGKQLDEMAGIKATKELLERVRDS